MIEELKIFTEELVKSLVTEPDLVKVKDFLDEEEMARWENSIAPGLNCFIF